MLEFIYIIIGSIGLILFCTAVFYTQKLALANQEKLDLKRKKDKLLAKGYRYFEWKGITNKVTSDGILVEQTLHSGEGLFKDKEDLETYLKASVINLKWWREHT